MKRFLLAVALLALGAVPAKACDFGLGAQSFSLGGGLSLGNGLLGQLLLQHHLSQQSLSLGGGFDFGGGLDLGGYGGMGMDSFSAPLSLGRRLDLGLYGSGLGLGTRSFAPRLNLNFNLNSRAFAAPVAPFVNQRVRIRSRTVAPVFRQRIRIRSRGVGGFGGCPSCFP